MKHGLHAGGCAFRQSMYTRAHCLGHACMCPARLLRLARVSTTLGAMTQTRALYFLRCGNHWTARGMLFQKHGVGAACAHRSATQSTDFGAQLQNVKPPPVQEPVTTESERDKASTQFR